jgi:hypothetical protein
MSCGPTPAWAKASRPDRLGAGACQVDQAAGLVWMVSPLPITDQRALQLRAISAR